MTSAQIYTEIREKQRQLERLREVELNANREAFRACVSLESAESDETIPTSVCVHLAEIAEEKCARREEAETHCRWLEEAIKHLGDVLEMYEYLESEGIEP